MKIDRISDRPRVIFGAWAIALTLLTPAIARAAKAEKTEAAADASTYQWSAAITLPKEAAPAVERATLSAIDLTSVIFESARSDLADLRLHDSQGRPVAFVLRAAPTTRRQKSEKSWPAVTLAADVDDSIPWKIEFQVPQELKQPAAGIRIETRLRDFRQQVQVFASPDGSQWHAVSPLTAIFDYSRLVDVRNVTVPIESTGDRHFRLEIGDVTAEQAASLHELTRHFAGDKETDRSDRTTVERRPFRIDRIVFYRMEETVETTGAQVTSWPTSDFRSSEDREQQTVLEFSTRREPITQVTLLTDETNFSRAAVLQVPSSERGQETWRTVAGGRLVRLTLERIEKNELTLKCGEVRSDRYRVLIDNDDSPPITFRGATAEGPEYRLVFLAQSGEGLTLDWGRPDAKEAHYDTAAIRAALAAGDVPKHVELADAVQIHAVAKTAESGLNLLLGNAWAATVVIAGLSLLLAWGLYRAARRIDPPPAG